MRLTTALLAKMGELSKKYSNFPDRYIDRITERVYWRAPPGKPQFRVRKIQERKKLYYSIYRPWTTEFQCENFLQERRHYAPIEPIKNWSFFRGDRVEVLVGADKGKQGVVNDIVQERNWVFVQGLHTKIYIKGRTKTFPGFCIRKEQPLLVTSQVQLVDPFDLKGTPIEWRYTEEGDFVRVSTRSGKIIPIPESSVETVDFKTPDTYRPDEFKDTMQHVVQELTFEAKLKTFEMDIMDTMGIKEDRVPKKYYWY